MNTVATSRGGNRKGRPNYPESFKRQLAIAACEPDASVSRLALEHGLNTSMLFKWRRDYQAGRLGKFEAPVLLPVSLAQDESVCEAQPSLPVGADDRIAAPQAGNIEIEIGGALVRLNGSIDASQLRLVLRCLKAS